jgi:hypothetical protein
MSGLIDREFEMDNGWVDTFTYNRLFKAGYSVGGFVDNGVPKCVLYRAEGDNKFERIHEFDSMKELTNMVKLLLPPEGE